ncbi:hypothetical protein Dimus_035154 [Dionaea muscipula]
MHYIKSMNYQIEIRIYYFEVQGKMMTGVSGSILRNSIEESSSSKRRGSDRISSLPEEIRRKILSLLPIEDAVRSMVWSKGWRFLFLSLQNYVFDDSDFPDMDRRVEKFKEFIDWSLFHHDDSAIETLTIAFPIFDDEPCPQMNSTWINTAVEHNVQKLDLEVTINGLDELPNCLFTCASLTTFRLVISYEVLRLPDSLSLHNLKQLTVMGAFFYDENALEKIFSGCPVLECFFIKRCNLSRLASVTVSSPRLKSLYIIENFDTEKRSFILQTPRLETLCYDDTLARDYNVGSISPTSEVDLSLRADFNIGRTGGELGRLAVNLLNGFSCAEKLVMNLFFTQVLSNSCTQLIRLRFFENLQELEISIWPTEAHVKAMVTLLTRSRSLSSLHIEFTGSGCPLDALNLESSIRDLGGGVDDLFLSDLDYIHLENFEGLDIEMKLLKFLLTRAGSLSEMEIKYCSVVGEQGGLEEPMEMSEEKVNEIRDEILKLRPFHRTERMGFRPVSGAIPDDVVLDG